MRFVSAIERLGSHEAMQLHQVIRIIRRVGCSWRIGSAETMGSRRMRSLDSGNLVCYRRRDIVAEFTGTVIQAAVQIDFWRRYGFEKSQDSSLRNL
jgi:hypothetical protein